MLLERHVSPDGRLTLFVERDETGDVCIGFAGLRWHTHPDMLVGRHGDDEEAALRNFVTAILADRLFIVAVEADGRIVEAWVDGSLSNARKAASQGGNTTVLVWSGRPIGDEATASAPPRGTDGVPGEGGSPQVLGVSSVNRQPLLPDKH
jgi:hypothetical protein